MTTEGSDKKNASMGRHSTNTAVLYHSRFTFVAPKQAEPQTDSCGHFLTRHPAKTGNQSSNRGQSKSVIPAKVVRRAKLFDDVIPAQAGTQSNKLRPQAAQNHGCG
jgi:hypothetical protein